MHGWIRELWNPPHSPHAPNPHMPIKLVKKLTEHVFLLKQALFSAGRNSSLVFLLTSLCDLQPFLRLSSP